MADWVDAQRKADAAYFEDWRPWLQLDGRPRQPPPPPAWKDPYWRPPPCPDPRGWSWYWLEPPVAARPTFRICTPTRRMQVIVASIPGAKRETVDRYDNNWGVHQVPAGQWRALLSALPELRRLALAAREAIVARRAAERRIR